MKRIILLVTALIITSSFIFAQGFDEISGISPMNITRNGHAATSLPDGRVLVVGGRTEGDMLNSTAEIYNPQTNEWTLYNIEHAHSGCSYVKLSDGRYMFFGGYAQGNGLGQSNVTTIFDPVTTQFTSGPTMNFNRAGSAAVVLKDNRVLIVGSIDSSSKPAEIFDPVNNAFSTVGVPTTRNSLPLIFPCNDGGAIIIGGYSSKSQIMYFDPITNEFALLATQLLSNETDWEAWWNHNSGQIADLQLYNGSYLFMIAKRIGNDYRQYTFAQFNPDSKQVSKISYWPSINLNGGYGNCLWGYTDNTMIKNPNKDEFYFLGGSKSCSPSQTKLNLFDYGSGTMYIPTGQIPFTYELDTSSKAWVNGSILYSGGIDKNSLHPNNEVHLLTPKKTLNTEEDTRNSTDIQIFPNPVLGNTFQVKSKKNKILNIDIVDMSGAVVRSIKGNEISNKHTITIERGSLPKGIYLLKLSALNAVYTKKISLH